MNPYLKQYQKSQVETATPERILIMLYDGAIQFLNIAKLELNANTVPLNVQKIHNNIMGAQKIVTEFQNTLNMDIGGEVAKNLYDLYDYLYNRLIEANMKKDVSIIEEVLGHLKELRDTWQQAIEIYQKETNGKRGLVSYEEEEEEEEEENEEEGMNLTIK